ncbi:MAG: spike base protein, RCAP_Rcc01079 family [Halanaerobiales bacterium]
MYNSKRHMFTPGKPGVVVQKDSRAVAMKKLVNSVSDPDTEIAFNEEFVIDSLGIYLSEPGDVEVITASMDKPMVLKNLNPGMIHPIMIKEVVSTNTTAPEVMVVF